MHPTARHPQWTMSPLTAALLLAIPMMARAQTANEMPLPAQQATAPQASAGQQELSTVMVTGQRAAYLRAMANKQASSHIMDSVVADDVQQLPDSTVAEALRRIPGASVTFNNDNIHGRDEAERPVLRGLDARYNNTTVDGLGIASVDSNTVRGARLDLLPASMIDRLEVYKTWTPDFNANAIGGSTNVATRSAFAKGGGFHANASIAAGNVSNHGQPSSDSRMPTKGEFSISNTWGEDAKYGISLAGYKESVDSYTVGHASSDSTYYNYFNAAGIKVTDPSSSNGYSVPQNSKYFWFQDSRQRQGVTSKLEAKPNKDVYGFLTFGHYETSLEETRHENYISTTQSGAPTGQTATSGSFATGEAELGYAHQPQERKTNVLQLGADWNVDDEQKVSFRHGSSKATSSERRSMYKYIQGLKYNGAGKLPSAIGTASLANSYALQGGVPVITLNNPGNWTDASKWQADYYRDGANIDMENRLDDTRLDWRNKLSEDSRGWGFGAGLGRTSNRYNYNSDQTDQGPARAGLTGEGVISAANVMLPDGAGLPLLMIDPVKAAQQLANNPRYMTANVATNAAQLVQDDFKYKELLRSAYLMAGYNTDSFHSLFGVRYDGASIGTSGNQKTVTNGVTTWSPVDAASSYHYFLPSLSGSFDITPELKLRGAVAKTIGRPDYESYAPRVSITEATDGTISISKGNPDIKSRESTNIDLSLEKYMRNGMVSLAVFDKNIKNEIYTAKATDQPFLYTDGTTRIASISQPQNSSGARVTGVELSAIINTMKDLHPALKNIGASANLSWMKGRLGVTQTDKSIRTVDRLLGQPDTIANLAVFYNNNGLETRLAYNRTGSSLRAVDVSAPWNDVFWKARQQIDLSASYRLNKNVTLFGEIKNLASAGVTSLTGPNRNLLKDTYLVGRTIWVGAKWQM